MKSAGIVKVSSVSNIGKVTKYNEQEQKISGTWHDQPHVYSPDELCTYQGAAANGGDSLNEQGNAFARNGINNQTLYRIQHPHAPRDLTEARTFIQSFDYPLNPQLTPGDVHNIGMAFNDELHYYFQDAGLSVNDSLVSTHLDRNQPKQVPYAKHELQPHLHNHILLHAFTPQGEALSKHLRKTNLHDLQDINDRVTERFNLHDYYFAKLQHLVYPMSAKTNYRASLGQQSLSHLGLACQRFLNANRMAYDRHPNDFEHALRYRNRLLKYNFAYRTKQKADLRHGTSNQVFTMHDFLNNKHQHIWYNTRNLRVLQWQSPEDAQVERLITHLDFNHASQLTPTHREYRKTMQYAIQANDQAKHMSNSPHLRMKTEHPQHQTKSSDDLSSHIHFSRQNNSNQNNYLISLRSIFLKVHREEEKLKKATNHYVQKIKIQLNHIKSRIEQRHKERAKERGELTYRHRASPNYRENELYQYMTFYHENRHGKIQAQRVKQRIHQSNRQRTIKHQKQAQKQQRQRIQKQHRIRSNRLKHQSHLHFK